LTDGSFILYQAEQFKLSMETEGTDEEVNEKVGKAFGEMRQCLDDLQLKAAAQKQPR